MNHVIGLMEGYMSKRNRSMILGLLVVGLMGRVMHGQTITAPPCPGYNPANNTNLACEIATAIRSGAGQGGTLSSLPAALAAQVSNLPIATAVSGTGITFVNGIPTFSAESLGTILTQRGDTLGKHRLFFSFNYQRYGFGSVDGVRFKNFDGVNTTTFAGIGTSSFVTQNRIDLTVDQYTFLGTFGITSRTDLALIVPFSTVNLTTTSNGSQFNFDTKGNPVSSSTLGAINLAGSKSGPGDVTVSLKQNVVKTENKISLAVGSEFRIPTGDEINYLGTGAYGIKPYAVISHTGKRFTPNFNFGYQWNSKSSLYFDPITGDHLNLPASLYYTGGLDVKLAKRLTMVGEFLGQYVINGPRIVQTKVPVGSTTFPSVSTTNSNGKQLTSSYSVDNAGVGFKINPFGGLLVSLGAQFKLDDAGLRAKWVPLVGVSYRF